MIYCYKWACYDNINTGDCVCVFLYVRFCVCVFYFRLTRAQSKKVCMVCSLNTFDIKKTNKVAWHRINSADPKTIKVVNSPNSPAPRSHPSKILSYSARWCYLTQNQVKRILSYWLFYATTVIHHLHHRHRDTIMMITAVMMIIIVIIIIIIIINIIVVINISNNGRISIFFTYKGFMSSL